MQIRRAVPADYAACLALDATVGTSLVWQMKAQSTRDRVAVEFRESRLPRSLTVGLTREQGDPLQRMASSDLLLVADSGQVCGYLRVVCQRGSACVDELVVDPTCRRNGTAKALLQALRVWTRENGLRAVIAEVPARHHPAISLLQSCGFDFCGYHDHIYDGRGIVLLFAQKG